MDVVQGKVDCAQLDGADGVLCGFEIGVTGFLEIFHERYILVYDRLDDSPVRPDCFGVF